MKPFTPISRIKIDRGKCVGCRICEAVCNFHFKEQGNLETPALQIYRDTYTGKINYHVLENCDLCIKRNIPLCIEFCSFEAISITTNYKPKK